MYPWFLLLTFLFHIHFAVGQGKGATTRAGWEPMRTGAHMQLVRRAYSVGDGLTSADVRAVCIMRDGTVFAANGGHISRLAGERWVKETGPLNVSVMAAGLSGSEALAGGSDGIWERRADRWVKQAGAPTNVIALRTEPAGFPWALAESGAWRLDGQWKNVNDLDREMQG